MSYQTIYFEIFVGFLWDMNADLLHSCKKKGETEVLLSIVLYDHL